MASVPLKKLIHDFDDYTIPLSEEEQQIQASRCMMCGVAFCQFGKNFGAARVSGCPLHNLIPEWNDLVYRGLWDEAAKRMVLTNPFPEFTGRICPALCEAACNLAYVDEATTIRDNERAISEHEWAAGGPAPCLTPRPMRLMLQLLDRGRAVWLQLEFNSAGHSCNCLRASRCSGWLADVRHS